MLITAWFGAKAQKPDFIRTPNGYNTIVDWNLKAKTFILPSYLLTARPVTQSTLGTIFLNSNPADPHLYINNLSVGTYSPLAFISDIPNTFTSNFQGAGTSVSPRDLAINITISGTMTAKGGMLTGDTASTAYNVYTSRRKISGIGVTQVSGISQFGWASMASYIHLDTAHERVLYVPYNRAYPVWSQDLGVTKHRIPVIDNCVGCVIDTNTFTLTIPSSGPVVNSIFGRNGNVTAQSGDYNTSQVTESGNLYFTQARVLATPATGFSPAAGTISATDPLITVLNKLQGNITASVTGVSSFNTRGGAITLTTADVNATAPTVLGTVTAGSFPIANLSGSYPTFNQNTTGSAAKWTTARNVNGVALDGTANITITANTPGTHTNGYGLTGSPFSGANQTWAVDTTRGKLVTTYGLIDTINAHGATAGYGINPTLFGTGSVAVDSTQLGSKAWAFSAFYTKNQINTNAFTLTGLHMFNVSGIAATPTDILILGNSTLATSGVPVNVSGGLNLQDNTYNTSTAVNNVANVRIYTRGSSGSGPTNNLLFDFAGNSGIYSNQFSFSSSGGLSLGSLTAFGGVTAKTFLSTPSASAINTTATLTGPQVATQLITSTTVAAVTATFPSATTLFSQFGGAVAGSDFQIVVLNTGTNSFTIALPGSITAASVVTGGTNLVVAAGTSAKFGIMFPTSSTAEIYRVK